MNNVTLVGRLARDPDVRYGSENQSAVARFTVAVERAFSKDDQQSADFISCVAFGKTGEFIEKYFTKGKLIGLQGRIQTGSYTNKEGVKVYTTDVVAERVEFVGSKSESGGGQQNFNAGGEAHRVSSAPEEKRDDSKIPEGFSSIEDDDMPF